MYMVGIAGGSGSGKTTLAKKILKRLDGLDVGILHQDSYYLPSPPDHLKLHGGSNFDHPEAFDWDLFREQLGEIRKGNAIQVPVYDYSISRRTQKTEPFGPHRAVILEGILTLWEEQVRDFFDLKAYVNVDADIRFIRRFHRDVKERGRTIDSIIKQYYDTVRPMHREFLEPSSQFADIIIGEETDIAADLIASRVRDFMNLNA